MSINITWLRCASGWIARPEPSIRLQTFTSLKGWTGSVYKTDTQNPEIGHFVGEVQTFDTVDEAKLHAETAYQSALSVTS